MLLSVFCLCCCALGFSACGGSEKSNGSSSESDKNSGRDETSESTKKDDSSSSHTHEYGEWIIATEATCTTNGNRVRSCSCGETENESISAMGHAPIHTASKTETCTEEGNAEYWYCATCENYYSDAECINEIVSVTIPATGHTLVHTERKEATCTENGNIEYWYCTTCENYYTDTNATNEVKDVVIAATGHNSVNGYCEGCGTKQASEGLAYTLETNSVSGKSYVVSGIGSCTDTDILIPSTYNNFPVSAIGVSAFEDCSSLTSITLPETITSIRRRAFYRCMALTSVNIPETVTFIGTNAFYACNALTEIAYDATATADLLYDDYVFCNAGASGDGITVTIGANVTKIPAYLFDTYSYSAKIVNVVFEEGSVCESVGTYAFSGCNSLKSIALPNTVTSIGNFTFSFCTALTSVNLGNSLDSIGDHAFSGCSSLNSITIPNSVTSIGEWSFSNCTSLTDATIGNFVTSIETYAFKDCTSLARVTLGHSLTSIGKNAFENCTALTEINYNATALDDLLYGDSVFPYAGTNGEGITLTIGANVTKISDYLFCGAPKIVNVVFEEGSVCESIGAYAFYKCAALISVNIPDSVTSIGELAFEGCASLISITLPNALISIDSRAFYDCTSLTDVTIGNLVVSIEYGAFYGCTSLTRITFEGTIEQWTAISKSTDWNNSTGDYTVTCTDGSISKDGTVIG